MSDTAMMLWAALAWVVTMVVVMWLFRRLPPIEWLDGYEAAVEVDAAISRYHAEVAELEALYAMPDAQGHPVSDS